MQNRGLKPGPVLRPGSDKAGDGTRSFMSKMAKILRVTWIVLANAVANSVLVILKTTFFRDTSSLDADPPKQIVVYRIGNIGDLLVALPTLSAIRSKFPNAHITLLTSPGLPGALGAAEILPRQVWFDSTYTYYTPQIRTWNGRLKLVKDLRRCEFQCFIELSNQQTSLKEAVRNLLLARLIGCCYAAGTSVSQGKLFLREQLLRNQAIQESQRIYLAVTKDMRLPPYQATHLPVSPASLVEIDLLLKRNCVDPLRPFVVLHAGAKRLTNQWEEARFASVADYLAERWKLTIILTGSDAERPLTSRVARAMRTSPVDLTGKIDLTLMVALLRRALLYIGNDTGPMHIAAAVGTTTFAVFSARDFPLRWYPTGNLHFGLRHDVPCSPCFKEVCDKGGVCLDAITPKDLIALLDEHLTSRLAPLTKLETPYVNLQK